MMKKLFGTISSLLKRSLITNGQHGNENELVIFQTSTGIKLRDIKTRYHFRCFGLISYYCSFLKLRRPYSKENENFCSEWCFAKKTAISLIFILFALIMWPFAQFINAILCTGSIATIFLIASVMFWVWYKGNSAKKTVSRGKHI